MRRLGCALLLLVIAALLIAWLSMVRVRVEPPAGAPAPARPAQASPPEPAGAGPLLVPVQGIPRTAIHDTWGESRANGARAHQATDIMAPGGVPMIAAAPGTVEKLFYSNSGGGISVYVRSPDRQWSYYYAHLRAYAPGLAEGQQVRAGALLGYVGDTGNAGIGNYHLHFAMARMGANDRWWQGQPVNPYPLLAGAAPRR